MTLRQSETNTLLMLSLLCLFCVFVPGCAGSPDPASVTMTPRASAGSLGVLDAQRILNETDAGKKAKDSLSAYVKSRQDLIKLEEKELKRMEESLIKQRSVLSANARKEREEKFRRRMMQYQQKAATLNREVQEKQREVLDGFRTKVEKIVSRVARELGVLVVIEKGPGTPTVYSDRSIDISDRVIQEFNTGSK